MNRKRTEEAPKEPNQAVVNLLHDHLPPVLSSIVAEYSKASIDGKFVRSFHVPNYTSQKSQLCIACTNQHIVIVHLYDNKVEFRNRMTFKILKTIDMSANDVASVNDEEVVFLDHIPSTVMGFHGLCESGQITMYDGKEVCGFAAHRHVVAVGCVDGYVHMFDWKEKKCMNTFKALSLNFTSDMSLFGKRLFIPDMDEIGVYDVESGFKIFKLERPQDQCRFYGTAVSCDEVYAADNSTGDVHVWSQETGRYVRTFSTGQPGSGLALTPDGQLAVADYENNVIRVFC